MTSPHILMYSDKKARGWERCQASFLGFAWSVSQTAPGSRAQGFQEEGERGFSSAKSGSTSWLWQGTMKLLTIQEPHEVRNHA